MECNAGSTLIVANPRQPLYLSLSLSLGSIGISRTNFCGCRVPAAATSLPLQRQAELYEGPLYYSHSVVAYRLIYSSAWPIARCGSLLFARGRRVLERLCYFVRDRGRDIGAR